MSNYNRGFGKLEDGKLSYAPVGLYVFGRYVVNPKPSDYVNAGYKQVVDEMPTEPAPEGCHWQADGWRDEFLRIARVYRAVENPPAPARKFSKLKLYGALVEARLWDKFEAWLKDHEIEGKNGYTAFSLAQDLSDDHPLFNPIYAEVKSALGISDEVAEMILEAAREG